MESSNAPFPQLCYILVCRHFPWRRMKIMKSVCPTQPIYISTVECPQLKIATRSPRLAITTRLQFTVMGPRLSSRHVSHLSPIPGSPHVCKLLVPNAYSRLSGIHRRGVCTRGSSASYDRVVQGHHARRALGPTAHPVQVMRFSSLPSTPPCFP